MRLEKVGFVRFETEYSQQLSKVRGGSHVAPTRLDRLPAVFVCILVLRWKFIHNVGDIDVDVDVEFDWPEIDINPDKDVEEIPDVDVDADDTTDVDTDPDVDPDLPDIDEIVDTDDDMDDDLDVDEIADEDVVETQVAVNCRYRKPLRSRAQPSVRSPAGL